MSTENKIDLIDKLTILDESSKAFQRLASTDKYGVDSNETQKLLLKKINEVIESL